MASANLVPSGRKRTTVFTDGRIRAIRSPFLQPHAARRALRLITIHSPAWRT